MLNIGEGTSNYIIVRNVAMRFQYSEKVVFAELFVSRKTGNFLTDEETGEVITKDGEPVPERVYTKWEGRFCGNAFEGAKTLRNGQKINVTQGWVEKEEKTSAKTGKTYTNIYVVINDFELSDAHGAQEDEITED